MGIKPAGKHESTPTLWRKQKATTLVQDLFGKSSRLDTFTTVRRVRIADLGSSATVSKTANACPKGPWRYTKSFLIGMLKGKCLVGLAAADARILSYHDAMPHLIKLLNDKSLKPIERARVVEAIGKLHAPEHGKKYSAASVVPKIIAYLKSKNTFLQQCAAAALGDIEDKRGLPALRAYLKTKPGLSERMAAEIAIDSIVDAQKEKEAQQKKKQAEMVKQYTTHIKDKRVKRAVQALLGSKDWDQRGQGALILKRIAWMYKKHDNIYKTSKFKSVLPAIPGLLKALEDSEPIVRMHAATALGEFGPAARKAVPTLRKILKSKPAYPSVNKEVRKALKKIQVK